MTESMPSLLSLSEVWSRPASPEASILPDSLNLKPSGRYITSGEKSRTAPLGEAPKYKSGWRGLVAKMARRLGMGHKQDVLLQQILVGVPDAAIKAARLISGLVPGLHVAVDILDEIWSAVKVCWSSVNP